MRQKTLWVTITALAAVMIMGGSLVYFLDHGYAFTPSVPDDHGTPSQSEAMRCQQLQQKQIKELAPVQSQLDDVDSQLNAIGQKLSSDISPGGTPASILDIANKYDKSDVPLITSLTHQYNDLRDRINAINSKYGC